MDKKTTLKDLCSFPGFRALARTTAHPDHPDAVIVTLKRCQKKHFVPVEKLTAPGMTRAKRSFATWMPLAPPPIWRSQSAGSFARAVKP